MAAVSERAELLQELFREGEFFGSVDEKSLRLLAERMRPVTYSRGTVICEEGEPAGWTFIVAAGEVAVVKSARDGARIQVTTLERGDWGGMMSLFERSPRSARLLARTDAELWGLDHQALEELLGTVPGLAMGLLGFMSKRLRMDAVHLAATLRHVSLAGLEGIYEACTPDERLMLDTINHRVAAAESLDAIMNFLFDSIRQIGDCDRLGLAFVEDDGERIVSHWTRTTYEEVYLRLGYSEDLEGSSLSDVLGSGRPRVIRDLSEYLRSHPGSRSTQLVVREGLRSSMTCPLVVEGRPVGLLFRSSCRPGAFDAHQVRLHEAIAQSIGQAVEKAYRIEQLTEANRAYGEVVGFVAHELKSPIASMVTDAGILADGYTGPLTDAQRDTLQRMIKKGERTLQLVDDYLNLDRLESGRLQCQFRAGVNLVTEVVEPVLEAVEPQRLARSMALERCFPDPAPVVEADPGLLRVALLNVADNGVKYGREGGVLRVTVESNAAEAVVAVWNEGPGFDEEQRGRLFRKFSRLDEPELKKQKGTGVGLYSAWRIVRQHRGRIRARSEPGAWARFTISLPRVQEVAAPDAGD